MCQNNFQSDQISSSCLQQNINREKNEKYLNTYDIARSQQTRVAGIVKEPKKSIKMDCQQKGKN